MSHGTSSRYQVRASAEEANRRAVAAMRAKCEGLRELLVAAQTEAEALGVVVVQPRRSPRGEQLRQWQQHEAELNQALVSVRRAAEKGTQRLWREEIGRRVGTLAGIRLDIAPAAPQAAAGARENVRAATEVADDTVQVRTSVERALAVVGTLDDDAARLRLADLAAATLTVLSDDPNAAQASLSILRSQVEQALRLQDARARLKRRAEELSLLLAQLPDDEAAALAVRVRAATTSAVLDEAETALAGIRERVRAEQDRRYVIEQTARALLRMGYQVDDEFVTTALAGRVLVRPPEIPGYGIELEFQEGRSQLLTETVAITDDSSGDVAAQVSGCAAVEVLGDGLAVEGVQLQRRHTTDPGQLAVRRVVPAARPAEPARRRRPAAARQEGHVDGAAR